MSNSVLVVDDEKGIRFAFCKALEKEGYTVYEAETGKEAIEQITQVEPSVVLLDMKLPDTSGIIILKQIKEMCPNTVVIMMTAFGDVEMAVEAMQLGAENFRLKPFNVAEMKNCIKRALENSKNKQELASIKDNEKQKYSFQNIIGESKIIRNINELIKKIAKSPSTTVLIQGPSGTGKELVARAIHYNSDRVSNRFIEVNCTAIPESLLESELFGHERGSFTDAKKEHRGIFEQADGGTLFLDEIGDMPISMQAKLLRVLQEKRFKRVGGTRDISVDVRVIASTNVNLDEAVKKGVFREDLYYRLKVIPINLPSLKDRDKDSLLIAKYYVERFSKEFKKNFTGLTESATNAILAYEWPGNIRELKNIIERAVLLENGNLINEKHLNLEGLQNIEYLNEETAETISNTAVKSDASNITLFVESLNFESVEKALIEKALKENLWNRNLVSKILGINRTTLYTKIKKYDLEKFIKD